MYCKGHPTAIWDGDVFYPKGTMEDSDGYQECADEELPPTVRDWAGLSNHDPQIDPLDGTTAIHANDALNWGFNQIADKIEENL